MIEDFGVIVACCDQDYLFAKGCCASIRHFLGDVPICLIVDGTFSIASLKRVYGVHEINYKTVSNHLLRERSFGYGVTKMIAFWESPWKHFLYLDADTNVWGNILKYSNFLDFDVIIDKPYYGYSDDDVSNFFFNIHEINTHFPDFRWQNHRHHYFCTGVFFATRDIFSLDEYIDILNLISKNPKLFYPGEMGLLNFMICRAADEGRIRLGQENIQLIVPDFEQDNLRKRFPVNNAEPVYQDEDVVIHWCGAKPTSINPKVYSEPMNFSRKKFIRDAWGDTELKAEVRLKREELKYYFQKKFRKAYKKVSALMN